MNNVDTECQCQCSPRCFCRKLWRYPWRCPNRSVLGKRVALQLNERWNLNPLLWYHTCNLWIVIQLPEVSTTKEEQKNCCEISPKKESPISTQNNTNFSMIKHILPFIPNLTRRFSTYTMVIVEMFAMSSGRGPSMSLLSSSLHVPQPDIIT